MSNNNGLIMEMFQTFNEIFSPKENIPESELDQCDYCDEKYPEGLEHDCPQFCDCGRDNCIKCLNS